MWASERASFPASSGQKPHADQFSLWKVALEGTSAVSSSGSQNIVIFIVEIGHIDVQFKNEELNVKQAAFVGQQMAEQSLFVVVSHISSTEWASQENRIYGILQQIVR